MLLQRLLPGLPLLLGCGLFHLADAGLNLLFQPGLACPQAFDQFFRRGHQRLLVGLCVGGGG